LTIQILILQDASWTGKAKVALAIFLVQASSHGIARSKLVWLSLLQRLSTLLLEAVVHKSSDSNNNMQTLVCKSARSL